jgi:predicted double-glycine peptidase
MAIGMGHQTSRLHWLILALLIGISGCTSVQPPSDSVGISTNRVELTDVPFYAQTDHQCGPAALATVLTYAGVSRTAQQLEAEVFIPQRQGSLAVEMLGATRRAGLVPYVLKPQTSALFQEVAAGNPVLVLQNLRFDFLPLWHFAVVVGFDSAARTVTLRSGGEKRYRMSMNDFDNSWAKAERWAFVAVPVERLPATANATDFVHAAITLARVSPEQAARAYQTALRAWPDDLLARLALGNSDYRNNHLAAAQDHYQQATVAHPDSADAWQNLAQVLDDTHQMPQALEASAQALRLRTPTLQTHAAPPAALGPRP